MKLLNKYLNGNVTVTLFDNGTKIQEWDDNEGAHPDYPNSMDIKITDYCDAGCKWCLVPETIVEGKTNKQIIDLIKGDLVYSLNENTGNVELKEVYDVMINEYDSEIIIIETDSNKIRITPNHKVYTQNRGWIPAGNLQLDDEILKF